MKFFGYVFSLLLMSIAASPSDTTIPITDNSAAANPIQNIGSCIQSDYLASGKLIMSDQDHWTAKNTGEKSIVAFVERLDVTYPNGGVFYSDASYNAYFHPGLLNSGETVPFSMGDGVTHSFVKTDAPRVQPQCEVEVRWIQFSDGSTFGKNQYASTLLQNRIEIQSALMHLNEVYATQGIDKFIEQLNQRVQTQFADAYIGHLRGLYEANGHDPQATIDRLRQHLAIAEQRANLIRLPQTGP
jgi:hypothetical protein